jgi:hypothetical protein
LRRRVIRSSVRLLPDMMAFAGGSIISPSTPPNDEWGPHVALCKQRKVL